MIKNHFIFIWTHFQYVSVRRYKGLHNVKSCLNATSVINAARKTLRRQLKLNNCYFLEWHSMKLCRFNDSGMGHLQCLWLQHGCRICCEHGWRIKNKSIHNILDVKRISGLMPILSPWHSHRLHLAVHPKAAALWDFCWAAAFFRQTCIRQVTVWTGISFR